MDKIVDHLFVFKGDGVIEDFPGNYTDYRVYEDSKPKDEEPNVSPEKGNDTRPKSENKAKLSYKEKMEFETIEGDIEKLTLTKKQIEANFLDGTLTGDEINKLAVQLQEISKKIEEKEERWFELSSKLES
jgi:ATP-binding cassette subfamily F protein uup